ncbi:hypothetical protein BD410DRAFT_895213 [Rickenella mellea]|uniref:F-box domain-containing protein n=1 Tax=Rickenella mellea TaxID=50990 RepID=A0A4Y7QH23_9AGAM|nr:hypothetical protein BD410DRAFT_895213 [Rickenella mellea]
MLKMIFLCATYAGDDPYHAVTHTTSNLFDKFEKDNLDKMETKAALTRTSRRFRRIALEFLFEFLSIKKPKQAVELVKMMKKHSSNSSLRPHEWIKFLFATCCTELVTEILHLCCGLVGFSWAPLASEAKSQRLAAAQDEMISNIPTNIRFLRWNRPFQFNTFATFLHKASASLQVLYTHGAAVGATLQQPVLRPSYPSLTHLHVVHLSGFDWLDTVTLDLPELIELSVFCQYSAGNLFPEVFRNASKSLRVLRLGYYF